MGLSGMDFWIRPGRKLKFIRTPGDEPWPQSSMRKRLAQASCDRSAHQALQHALAWHPLGKQGSHFISSCAFFCRWHGQRKLLYCLAA